MMRDVARRVRSLEKDRHSALFAKAIPLIPFDDAVWLLSLPMNSSGTDWVLSRFTAEDAARAEQILVTAYAAASGQSASA